MKDLDFDELDRAVASALTASTPAESPVLDEAHSANASDNTSQSFGDNASPAAASPSISAHAVHSRMMPSAVPSTRTTLARKVTEPTTPEPSSVESVVSEEPATAPTTAPPSFRRTIPHREGRFMDVMRASSQPQTKPAQPSSQTITPPVSQTVEDEESYEPALSSEPTNPHLEAAINELLASEGHAVPSVEAVPAQEQTEIAADDPSTSQTETDSEPEDVSLESIAAELGKVTEPEPETQTPLASSPFLADAKVEKRPLGTADEPTVSAVDEPVIEPTIVMPETENTPMPEELQSDLMAIESTPASSTAVSVSSDTTQSQPAAQAAAVASGPTSIARQYKEQPRTASEDDESGAIFDPQTYHQPIEHPAKKSSGWIWVIGIIVVILVAVAAAVAAWFSGILPVQL